MAKNFKLLEAKMSPESKARSEATAQQMISDMALDELREALELTQVQVASMLKVNQSAVSKLERRADMYLSTLRNFIHAMGGHLDILAVFPTGQVRISQLSDIRPEEQERQSRKRKRVGPGPGMPEVGTRHETD